MPPAFVLSQDQTLRKNKFLSEISDLAFLFDSVVPTAQIHQSVTSHYSVFKQHRSFHRHPPLFSSVSFNLASFGFLSNPNLKIFQFFLLSQTTSALLSQRSVSFNLALSEFFASSNLNFFEFSFWTALMCYLKQLAVIKRQHLPNLHHSLVLSNDFCIFLHFFAKKCADPHGPAQKYPVFYWNSRRNSAKVPVSIARRTRRISVRK